MNTEIIDVDRAMGQAGVESTIPGTFVQEDEEPVLKNFDHLILKPLPSGISKGELG